MVSPATKKGDKSSGARRLQKRLLTEGGMLQINVTSEWAQLRSALVHDAGNIIDLERLDNAVDSEELARHPEHGSVRRDVFVGQHARFRRLLDDAGVRLISPATQPNAFCQVYTRDPCFVVGNTLFIGRPKEPYRQLETAGLAALRSDVTRTVVLDEGVIEGGDVMALRDDLVLVGTGDITTPPGVAALRECLQDCGVTVVQVPHTALHLDCCLAPLPNHKALYSASRLPQSSRALLQPFFSELMPLDANEDLKYLAANIVWLNPQVVVSTAHAPRTNALLRQMDYLVHEIEYTEIIHLWGSARCTVCPLSRGE
jgi:N-dimethylarginine dimethylaminohydrolase